MPPTVATQASFSYRFMREMAPQSHRLWQAEKEEEITTLQAMLTAWLEDVTRAESISSENVYQNPELGSLDLIQHRIILYDILGTGEKLSLFYRDFAIRSSKESEVRSHIGLIDQKLKDIFGVLLAWHGPLSMQEDIPAGFKEAAKEADAGSIVDLEFPADGPKQ